MAPLLWLTINNINKEICSALTLIGFALIIVEIKFTTSKNCLLHEGIEGQMTEIKVVGRRRTQLLEDMRNRRRYWELKEEAEDQNRWKRQFVNRT